MKEEDTETEGSVRKGEKKMVEEMAKQLKAGGEGRKGRRGKLGSGMEKGVMERWSRWAVQPVFLGTKQIAFLREG